MTQTTTDNRLAIIYPRVSSQGQIDNYSVPEQIATMTRRAQELGYTNVQVRPELAKSAETIKERPVLRGILDDVQRDMVRAILVIDLTRLSRDKDVIDGLEIRRICGEHNTVIVTKDMVYDCTRQDSLMLYVMGLLGSAIQKQMNVGNMTRGLRRCAEEGELFNGVVPFGYDRIREPFGKRQRLKSSFRVNPDEAPVIEMIFNRIQDHGTAKVAAWLNSQGMQRPIKSMGTREYLARRFAQIYPLPPASRLWRGTDVLHIVRNPIYRGVWEWGRHWQSNHYRDQMDHISLPMERLRVVSDPVWLAANAVLDRRSQVPPRTATSPYLFSGVYKCSNCGGPMVGHRRRTKSRGERVPGYRCSNHRDGRDCRGSETSERLARIAVRRHLGELLPGLGIESALDRAIKDHLGRSSAAENIARLERQLVSLKEQADRVIDLYVREEITDEERLKRMSRIRDGQRHTERQLVRERSAARNEVSIEQLRAYVGNDLRPWIRKLTGPRLSRVAKLVYAAFRLTAKGEGYKRRAKVIKPVYTEDFSLLRAERRHLSLGPNH